MVMAFQQNEHGFDGQQSSRFRASFAHDYSVTQSRREASAATGHPGSKGALLRYGRSWNRTLCCKRHTAAKLVIILCSLAVSGIFVSGLRLFTNSNSTRPSFQGALQRALNCSFEAGDCTLYWDGAPRDGARTRPGADDFPDFLLYTVSVLAPGEDESASDSALLREAVLKHYREFCSKSNIGLLVIRTKLDGLDPHWAKVTALSKLVGGKGLDSVRHFMYLDSDILFLPGAEDPRRRLLPRMGEAAFMITSHISDAPALRATCEVGSNYTQNPDIIRQCATLEQNVSALWRCSPNTGAFLAANDANASQIARAWLGASRLSNHGIPGFFRCGNGGGLYDQAGLNLYVTPRFLLSGQMRLVEADLMNMRKGEWVKHYLGYPKARRAELMWTHLGLYEWSSYAALEDKQISDPVLVLLPAHGWDLARESLLTAAPANSKHNGAWKKSTLRGLLRSLGVTTGVTSSKSISELTKMLMPVVQSKRAQQ